MDFNLGISEKHINVLPFHLLSIFFLFMPKIRKKVEKVKGDHAKTKF